MHITSGLCLIYVSLDYDKKRTLYKEMYCTTRHEKSKLFLIERLTAWGLIYILSSVFHQHNGRPLRVLTTVITKHMQNHHMVLFTEILGNHLHMKLTKNIYL